MRSICRFLFWITGWKIAPNFPDGIKKAVLVHAPHTSNLDFFIGYAAFRIYRINTKFLIKKEAFKGPMGWIVKGMGGIPVDREKKSNIIEFATELIRDNDEMLIMFTPEGTRKYNPDWKTGFYRLAQNAEVPIIITFIDYKNKVGGFGPDFKMTGDVDKDIAELKEFYKTIQGRHPEHGVR